MGLYFSRLFLRDQYSVAPDKFGQKQDRGHSRTQSNVKVKIKSEITPDNAGQRRTVRRVGRVVYQPTLFLENDTNHIIFWGPPTSFFPASRYARACE